MNYGLFKLRYTEPQLDFLATYGSESEKERALANVLSVNLVERLIEDRLFSPLSLLVPYKDPAIIKCKDIYKEGHGKRISKWYEPDNYLAEEFDNLKSMVEYIHIVTPDAKLKPESYDVTRECDDCEVICTETLLVTLSFGGNAYTRRFAVKPIRLAPCL